MDFQKIIEQFKDTENLKFLRLIETKFRSPDEIFYKFETNEGIFYLFEIDYISEFNQSVLKIVRDEIGDYKEILKVKFPFTFEDAQPVKLSKIYFKPSDWEIISEYANDKFGSANYYFNFLIRA